VDLIETIGARMVLVGAREYQASLKGVQEQHAALNKEVQAGKVPSEELNAATVSLQAAQDKLAASTKAAVTAEHEYQAALREAQAAAVADSESATTAEAAKSREATARLEAAAAAREAALVEMRADQETAVAAKVSADEVEVAEGRKVAAAEGASGTLKMVGWGAVAVAAVVAGASVKMAGDFEQSTERLVTSAGETNDNLDMVRRGILGMAGEVGYSAEDLSAAMYKVESGGRHGAEGLDVLKAAAQGAKTENADLTVVADVVTSVLQDYHLKGSDAADVTSKLVAATASGKTSFEELSGAMAAVLPRASAAHVSLDDILGDLASMTVHGMSAQQASQNLADAIQHMQAPTSVQSKELALLGINAQQLSDDLGTKGLSGTIHEITDAIAKNMGPGASKVILDMSSALKGLDPAVRDLGQKLMDGSISQAAYNKAAKGLDPILAGQAGQFATLAKSTHQIGNTQMSGQEVMQSYSKALRDAMGDATGLNVALMLTGENSDITSTAIGNVRDATKEADGSVRGWSDIQGTFNTRLSQAKDGMGALAIQIGTYLLPPLTAVLGWIASGAQWLSQHKDAAMALAIVIGVVLVAGLAAAAVALWSMVPAAVTASVALFGIEAPLLLIIGVIALVVGVIGFAVFEIVQHWQGILGFFKMIGAWFAGPFLTPFKAIGAWFAGPFVDFFKMIGSGIMTAFRAIATAAVWLWQTILQPVFNAISLIFRVFITIVITVLVTPIVLAIRGLAAIFTWWWLNVTVPVFNGIRTVMVAAWNWINSNVIQPIWRGLQWVGAQFVALYQNYVVPAWNGIRAAIMIAWYWIYTNIILPINLALLFIGSQFVKLWQNYVVPAWNGIRDAILTAWNWINDHVFQPIWRGIQWLGDRFSDFWHGVIVPVWNGISDAIHTAWTWIDEHVFTPIHQAIDRIKDAFNIAKDYIGAVWDQVKEKLATPIHWVVDHVYTDGIKAVWDHVADFTGLGHLPDAPQFAGGGVLGGYSPGQDSVHALLSPGEAVLVPELTAAIGADRILALNAAFSNGRAGTVLGPLPAGLAGGGIIASARALTDSPARFDGGGILGGLSSVWNSVSGWVGGVAGGTADFFSDPIGTAKKWLNGVIDATIGDQAINTPVGQIGAGVPKHAIDGLMDKVQKWWDDFKSGVGAIGSMIGGVAAGGPQVTAWVLQALAMMGMSPALAPGVISLIMHESGGNPNAINLWDSNAQAGHPSQGLMQTIPSTFAAYVLPSLAGRPITDPIANITAGVRYAVARYGEGMLMGGGRHDSSGGYMGYSGGGLVLAEPRASGGPVDAGAAYLVGERGPELFVPGASGQVFDADTTASGLSGPGLGGTVVYVQEGAVVVHGATDPRATYEAVVQGIGDAVARR
jgi:hypothetical protein